MLYYEAIAVLSPGGKKKRHRNARDDGATEPTGINQLGAKITNIKKCLSRLFSLHSGERIIVFTSTLPSKCMMSVACSGDTEKDLSTPPNSSDSCTTPSCVAANECGDERDSSGVCGEGCVSRPIVSDFFLIPFA